MSHVACDLVFGSCTATPDTSADFIVLGFSCLDLLGTRPDQARLCNIPSVSAANGSNLDCVGTLLFTITYCGQSVHATALVCHDYSSMLLSWDVCRALYIVPQDYPCPITSPTSDQLCNNTVSVDQFPEANAVGLPHDISVLGIIPAVPTDEDRARFREQFLSHFHTVFASGDTLRTMEGPAMKIHLKPDAALFCLHAARGLSHLPGATMSRLSWRQSFDRALLSPLETSPVTGAILW